MTNTPAASIREATKRLDELNYSVGDTLDVKSSIILVVITILGTISGGIIATQQLPTAIKVIQVIGVLALVIAGVLSLIALWPRNFSVPPAPEKLRNYLNEWVEYYAGEAQAEEKASAEFESEEQRLALERISVNGRLASWKSKLNSAAFYATAVAVLMELASLSWFACARLF